MRAVLELGSAQKEVESISMIRSWHLQSHLRVLYLTWATFYDKTGLYLIPQELECSTDLRIFLKRQGILAPRTAHVYFREQRTSD